MLKALLNLIVEAKFSKHVEDLELAYVYYI